MSDRFTSEQRAAIDATGKTIVSASAGSGKTTVMIEKIIRLIKDGFSVKEILAVTFTKKAASQMKEKLSKALIQAINDPATSAEKKTELKKQLSEVSGADISTIHSFCSRLIRSHFFVAGVDNTFRVIGGDDAEGMAMKSEALDETFDEAYESKEENFLLLLSVYWRKKSDNALRNIILNTYEQLRGRADYKEYLQNSGVFDSQTFANVVADLHALLKEKCSYYLQMLQAEKEYFEQIEAKAQTALSTELCNFLQAILNANDYFDACALEKPKFTANRGSQKDSPEKKKHVEKLSALKNKVVKIYDDELSKTGTREEELGYYLKSGKIAWALKTYLLLFDEKYAQRKAERGVLDYADLEHKALELLSIPEIAQETRDKYRYVFVDEYQDVNPVQEAILSLVAGNNVFLVGDVKQSIYGFRGSKSKFFVQKQEAFEKGEGNSLVMKRNFRSSDKVLDAVNKQFCLAMTKDTCEVDYANGSYMERGGRYPIDEGKVRIHILPKEEKTPPAPRGIYSVREKTGATATEESLLAKTIRQIIQNELHTKWYDADTGEYKLVEYSDIAVLSRKKQGQIAKTVAAIAAEGIPVTAASAVNICDYAEVKTLIDVLSLIDNAEQDVPLCSALLSAMGELTADELTNIRLAYKEERFFRNACKKYAEEQTDLTAHKLRKFYDYYQKLRMEACVLDAGELLTKIIAETRMEARLLSRDNSIACLKRMHRFVEETAAVEHGGVHAFLQYLRDVNYKIEYSESGGENSVRVLTMHSSKGLEYPVVILDNLNAPFRGVIAEDVYVEEKYSLAPRAYDEQTMTRHDTLLRRLHERKELASSVADELNLYYVALTRAKYALHAVFEEVSPFPDVRYARSFADFTDFSVWQEYLQEDALFDVEKQPRTALVFRPDETLASSITKAFLWKYKYAGGENLPVKSSATRLMDGQAVENTGITQEAEVPSGIFDETDDLDMRTSREAGVAYHAFLEHFDFARLYENGAPIPRLKLKDLIKQNLENLTQETVAFLSEDKLLEILSNPVFYRLQGKTVYKERQFMVALPVGETFDKSEGKDENIIFQGAIDLMAVGQDEVQIIDYKYSKKTAEQLKTHYAPQLELYRLATAKILRIPKDNVRCYIVNIYRGFEVDMN